MTQNRKDTLYSEPHGSVGEFIFDQKVVDVFPDMIERSVPGYSTIIHMIGYLAERYAQANSHCYDLGCSLGAASLAMAQKIKKENVKIIAIDNSAEMIAGCKNNLSDKAPGVEIEFVCEDILQSDIADASVCVLNFTLQFIQPGLRTEFLQKIHAGMLPGGILILSEKLSFPDKNHDNLVTDLHHYFKKTNGYSELEIAQKRNALENVLVPESLATHQQRLLQVGFNTADLWFQCFNFASLVAIK